jgi:hypothetical protein
LLLFQVLRKYSGHASAVTSLAFSSDGCYFASGSAERFINLWDATEHGISRPVHTFATDSATIALHFHPQISSAYVPPPVVAANAEAADGKKKKKKKDDEAKAAAASPPAAATAASGYELTAVTENSTCNVWLWRRADAPAADAAGDNTDADAAASSSSTTGAAVTVASHTEVTVQVPSSTKKRRVVAAITAEEGRDSLSSFLSFTIVILMHLLCVSAYRRSHIRCVLLSLS